MKATTRLRGAKKKGVIYESLAQRHLQEVYGDAYIPSPWFKYFDAGEEKVKWCQPDGLLIDVKRGLITIVEIKLKHTANAWWQLQFKYFPVVKKVFGDLFSYPFVEVVQWYDTSNIFPVSYTLRGDLREASPSGFQVTIWNPKYNKR